MSRISGYRLNTIINGQTISGRKDKDAYTDYENAVESNGIIKVGLS